MSNVSYLASINPEPPTVTPNPNATPSMTFSLRTTTLFPWEEEHIQVHTVLIIVIFCMVCFLLLMAFFYAFCFNCSINPSPKDSRKAHGCSLEREDATFRCSSSDGQSAGNAV